MRKTAGCSRKKWLVVCSRSTVANESERVIGRGGRMVGTIERITIRAGLAGIAALLLSSCVASQPGNLLASYPDSDGADDAKIHVYSSVTDVRPMMSLQATAEKV